MTKLLSVSRLAGILLLLLLMFVASVAAQKAVVVDLDGSVEGFASLATVLKSPARLLLQAVICSGNSWGHLASIELNVKNFLATAKATDVVVALGVGASMPDSFDPSRRLWGCRYSQGFPKTPRQASLRGMNVSRMDVDGLFGYANQLQLAPSAGAKPLAAVDALDKIFSSYSSVVYISLCGLSSLATYLQTSGTNPSKIVAALDLHIFESGNGLAVDPIATSIIFSFTPSIKAKIYTPNLYARDVTFNRQTWNNIMQALAGNLVRDPSIAWLFTAWDGRRKLFQRNTNPNDYSVFFQQRGPATSLVTLCAVDVTLSQLCDRYAVAVTNVSIAPSNPSSAAGAGGSLVSAVGLSGNNVTIPVWLVYTPVVTDVTAASPSSSTFSIFDTSASEFYGGKQLSVDFWFQWLGYLGIIS
jgi:hypothetical protein